MTKARYRSIRGFRIAVEAARNPADIRAVSGQSGSRNTEFLIATDRRNAPVVGPPRSRSQSLIKRLADKLLVVGGLRPVRHRELTSIRASIRLSLLSTTVIAASAPITVRGSRSFLREPIIPVKTVDRRRSSSRPINPSTFEILGQKERL